ncbi:Uncharacterized protein APZ42_027822 [Daphnia magna]|uniref:Uncharacterized protein n=1 Tax=Daphnia magna TaxID=35525 RepID=A0A164R1L5_9CRUS|nr:Uncharacterized protein APZ42_027822 [Daphnia magna]
MQEERKFAQPPTNKSYSFFYIYIWLDGENGLFGLFERGNKREKKRGSFKLYSKRTG